MKNALLKDTFREIRRTLSRFLSIFFIVALGVAFFAGVKATCPDMKITADKYYDDYNLMDIRLLSTIGFNDEDVNAVKKAKGVKEVLPTYSMDAMTKIKNMDLVLKVLALPLDKSINQTRLISGRYPERTDECITEKGKLINPGMAIGSKITLFSGTDKNIDESLKTREFTIVGIVETPYYISFERGTSSIGNGKVNSFIMIPQEDFKQSVYTDMFVTVKGAKELLTYNDKYTDIVEPVLKDLESIGTLRAKMRYSDIVSEANEKLSQSRKELKDAEKKQKSELVTAEEKLNNARKDIAEGERELASKEKGFNKTISDAEAKLNSASRDLEEGEKEYAENLQAYNELKKQADIEIPAAEQQIAVAQKQISDQEAQLNALKAYLAANPDLPIEKKMEIEATISAGEKDLEDAKAQLEASKAELEGKKKALAQGEADLAAARKLLDESKLKLVSERKNLDASMKSANSEFASAHRKLSNSKIDLEKGEADYKAAKKESDEKLQDARSKITEGEDKINKLQEPVWYVLDRNTNPGFVDYGNAADRMSAIAQVFPVFFFLVAALVCLTTMTRMVDEQRTYIGTLKALGYGKMAIASKYLAYAVLASAGGSIFGFTVGFRIFPTVIFNAYGIMYTMPPVITAFNGTYAIIATVFAVLSTTLAAWFACYKELMLEPAMLMRPKAPKVGKRIFLENIKFIWSRFNFTQKITARNLFRYKKRFLMTVMGIGGCTALLLSGFGLKDSIKSIVSIQFEELYKYDMMINLKDPVKTDEMSKITDIAANDKRISSYMFMKEQNVDVGAGKNEKSVTMIVPESIEKMEQFIIFRKRIDGKKVPFDEEGVILTEKLAKKLQVDVGDNIYIKDGDAKKINVKVSGITENYVSHYAYMSPALYEKVYGEKVKYQQVAGKITESSEEFEKGLSTDLMKNSEVSSIRFTTGISKDFNDIIGSLNYVILVLIVSAGALAFVVLYNLTNINITERLREIATIKVLGFYDNEVSSYVYRENLILTLIGMLSGLILGIFLHRFIVVTAEVDYVMFGRVIKPLSYVNSSVLTILFSILVNFVMYFRLKSITMVESLKSVD